MLCPYTFSVWEPGYRSEGVALPVGPWLPHLLTGIEPTGNMVKKRAEFTVETRSAGQGEVLVYVEDPAGHQEEVGLSIGRAGFCCVVF